MQTVNVYSSMPTGTRISLALLGLEALGMQVALRPLSEMPVAAKPRRRGASLRAELYDICVELATIGDILTTHEAGRQCLAAGTEQGLRFDREALVSRKRAIEATLRREEGGQYYG